MTPSKTPKAEKGELKTIPLTQGQFTIVDGEDLSFLNQWKWQAKKSSNNFYAIRRASNGKKMVTITMHGMLLKKPKGLQVDHINRNSLDNRKANLRICTAQQNLMNKAPAIGKSSRFKGVSWKKQCGKWSVEIAQDGKNNLLGYFENEEEAARTYDLDAWRRYGEFAYLNFPELLPPTRLIS